MVPTCCRDAVHPIDSKVKLFGACAVGIAIANTEVVLALEVAEIHTVLFAHLVVHLHIGVVEIVARVRLLVGVLLVQRVKEWSSDEVEVGTTTTDHEGCFVLN